MAKKELTPKQKASQLVALFESIAHPTIDCDKQFAKECARRCINEMIEQKPRKEFKYFIGKIEHRTFIQDIDFLEQVKIEIDKL
ncbi:MAG: hypothetical protein EBR82_81985 [Caulobacteraceae bacterium]|jgi:hypothetical protein|nr:hypothetical protein [Caulobacteraceae bacterium]